jgi:rhodanese-related sulfurtransferase
MLLGCAGGASSSEVSTTASPSELPRVSGPEARQLVADGALLLDVSPAARFEQTRIEGATNIPWNQLEGRLSELPHDRPILVYCGRGRASPGATRTLLERGFDARLIGARANYFRE